MRLAERVVGRVEAAERAEPAGVGLDQLEHPLIRLAVAAGLLEREDQRPRIDLLERVERLLRSGQQAGGVMQPDVDVRVEEPQVIDVATQHLDPRDQVALGVHRRRHYPRVLGGTQPTGSGLAADAVYVSRYAVGSADRGAALARAAPLEKQGTEPRARPAFASARVSHPTASEVSVVVFLCPA